jgi:hypothetical protein
MISMEVSSPFNLAKWQVVESWSGLQRPAADRLSTAQADHFGNVRITRGDVAEDGGRRDASCRPRIRDRREARFDPVLAVGLRPRGSPHACVS